MLKMNGTVSLINSIKPRYEGHISSKLDTFIVSLDLVIEDYTTITDWFNREVLIELRDDLQSSAQVVRALYNLTNSDKSHEELISEDFWWYRETLNDLHTKYSDLINFSRR